MTEQTRREALEAAFAESEKEETSETTTEAAAPAEKPEQTPYEKETQAAAKPDGKQKPVAKPDDQKPTEKPDEKAAKPDDQEAQQEDDKTPAPISWKAEEKALWSKVPKEVRAIIQRRELETQRALSTSAQARRFQDEFVRTVAPFAHLIRAQNSTPMAAVHNLMTTAAGLMTGSQQQKAAIVAEIISNYGVDIPELDRVLSNAPRNPNAGTAALPPQFAQALQPVYQFIEEINGQRQTYEQRQAEKAQIEIETFGQNKPFFDDLRDEMADYIETAARRGRMMTLEQAYKIARAAHPELVDPTETQRTQQQSLSEAAATLARARKAAGTIAGAPNAATQVPKTPTTRREQLAAAWDKSV
jgi:hypothetical protein